MPKYNTRQRQTLLSFLGENPDRHFSAGQIAEALQEKNISRSAVYRNLSDLEDEGKVRRLSKSNSRELYFQYVAADSCKGQLHLSCKQCGKTYHMDLGAAERLVKAVSSEAGFSVDKSETVLVGICENCRK